MRDFSLEIYDTLLRTFLKEGYRFVTMEEYCTAPAQPNSRTIIVRHDVDKRAPYSLKTAFREHALGIRASYYFRVVPQSDQREVIGQIAAWGHEIGYHYEDMSLAKGDTEQAHQLFLAHLEHFRQYYPVKTICMHGAPTSAYDGRDLWKTYSYRDEGIIGEPYFDINFDETLYLTDTGRRWDGYNVSVRDKVPQQQRWNEQGLTFHSTEDILRWLTQTHPTTNILMTTHPQRWTDNLLLWLYEAAIQRLKNCIKQKYYVQAHTK